MERTTQHENKMEIIELLAQNELFLADLYMTFSELFPDFKLWAFLKDEEIRHNSLVLSILENYEDGSVEFSDMHFSERTIKISIKEIETQIEKARNDGISLEDALNYAIKVEASLLEKKFLNYFSSNDEGIQNVLDTLRTDTKDHKKMLDSAKERFLKEKYDNENKMKKI